MVFVRTLLLRCYDGVYLVSSLTYAPTRQYSQMQTAANLSLFWGVQLNEKMTKD
jgi:hypothetical protein